MCYAFHTTCFSYFFEIKTCYLNELKSLSSSEDNVFSGLCYKNRQQNGLTSPCIQSIHINMVLLAIHFQTTLITGHAFRVWIQRGGGVGGPDHPLKNHKNRGFSSNIGLKNGSYQARIQCWAIIDTPAKRHLMAFRWRPDDGLLIAALGSSLPS